MKTFGDLEVGDTVYAIFPKYRTDGSWCYTIGDFKIVEKFELDKYSSGVSWLNIKLDNGFYFKPESNQSFHLGCDYEEGSSYNFTVEYFTDIKNIRSITNYESVIKDIEETLRKKYGNKRGTFE